MAFPSNPVNGQTTVVNNITFYYQASTNAWRRFIGSATNLTVANLAATVVATVSQLDVGTSVGLTSTEVFDFDSIDNYVDGKTGTFTLNYNRIKTTVNTPWNLDVYVNGIRQPAFKYNGDTVWQGMALPANKGYTLDYTGNIKFADALPNKSTVTISSKVGTNSLSTKRYPFNPLDIALGM